MAKKNQAAGFARSETSSPPTMPSSLTKQAALILNSVDITAVSFDEYLNMTNSSGTSGNEGPPPAATSADESVSAVDDKDTPVTGTEMSLPENTESPSETGSSKLKEKLLAARRAAPNSYNTSSPLKNNSVGDKTHHAAADAKLEPIKEVTIVDELISRFPEMITAPSKSIIVDIIILSDFLKTSAPTDGLGAQPIDYAQIEFLADCIIARSANHIQVLPAKKEVILNANPGEKAEDIEIKDPVAMQEEKVRLLFQVLSNELSARFPPDPAADPITSAEEEDTIFRENAVHLKDTISLNLSMFPADGKLHADILKFDREEEKLRLTKEAAENAKPKKETQAEVIRRNMDFLAQDPSMPTMPFEEDYVERYSNYEDMAKIGHMVNPDGPLGRAYRSKLIKQKSALDTEMARHSTLVEAQKRGQAGTRARIDGSIAGAHASDYFYTFGK
ncbi:hypothetical protein ONS95_011271 [Cadophora gregata]|uniref:uncharacterized protein n=1 Tax=Cadophora gregata TaxID=51156 RepID=UPI0026DAE387|nr:uncharacterized protein ONS95_011271 [Cadophora gregata]KAK0119839.1 hypothetical protein ONS95_011271 [Cadophora gregata]KAK0120874.1 hypothetical protein ONS96_011074 [Cadophora gregata f. sp. sojae]